MVLHTYKRHPSSTHPAHRLTSLWYYTLTNGISHQHAQHTDWPHYGTTHLQTASLINTPNTQTDLIMVLHTYKRHPSSTRPTHRLTSLWYYTHTNGIPHHTPSTQTDLIMVLHAYKRHLSSTRPAHRLASLWYYTLTNGIPHQHTQHTD